MMAMTMVTPTDLLVSLPSLNPMAVSSQFVSGAVQLLVSSGFAILVIQLLLIRQNRRKIEGEASGAEANAATALSGAALQMVKSANEDADRAQKDAQAARDSLREASIKAQEAQTLQWREMSSLRWELDKARMRVRLLEEILRQANIPFPPDNNDPPTEAQAMAHPQ